MKAFSVVCGPPGGLKSTQVLLACQNSLSYITRKNVILWYRKYLRDGTYEASKYKMPKRIKLVGPETVRTTKKAYSWAEHDEDFNVLEKFKEENGKQTDIRLPQPQMASLEATVTKLLNDSRTARREGKPKPVDHLIIDEWNDVLRSVCDEINLTSPTFYVKGKNSGKVNLYAAKDKTRDWATAMARKFNELVENDIGVTLVCHLRASEHETIESGPDMMTPETMNNVCQLADIVIQRSKVTENSVVKWIWDASLSEDWLRKGIPPDRAQEVRDMTYEKILTDVCGFDLTVTDPEWIAAVSGG